MTRHSPLDDPRTSAHAWARYRRLMRWMALLTLAVVLVTLGAFYWQNGLVSVHFFIATALGVGFAMLLMAALMGLVFLSSGTGHDASVAEFEDDQDGD
jgi:protein-S-isoprenylcysteine O-methyltransferase Ste14